MLTQAPRSDLATRFLAGALALLAFGALIDAAPLVLTVMAVAVLVVPLSRTTVVPFEALLAGVLLTILIVPVGRYAIPAGLPFELDLYRIVIGGVIAIWATWLLLDESVHWRSSPLDKPVLAIFLVILVSIAVNVSRVAPLGSAVLKATTFFASFVGLYFLVSSTIRTQQAIERVVRFLVIAVSAVAAAAIIEQRSGFNPFDHVSTVLPFLVFDGTVETTRDGLVRAVASADHPIALGVLFATVLPLAVGLAFSVSRRWWIAVGLIAVGVLATASRTPLLAVLAGGVVLTVLRPKEVRSLLPLLIPLIVVVKLALPGSIATVKNAFFPPGGLVAQQTRLGAEADPLLAGGRVRQLGPQLRLASRTPLLGQGYGTRQTGFFNPLRNAPILDNQWLGLVLETGIAGIVGWVWLILRAIRRLGARARARPGTEGWLAAALAASIAGFAAGMFTYDSLAFVQEAFVFWMVVALASSTLALEASRVPLGAVGPDAARR